MYNVISICHLQCRSCLRNQQITPKFFMDLDTFKEIASRCLYYGIPKHQLHPIVGDPLNDPTIFDKIDYLEQDDRADYIFFYTNLLSLTEEMIERMLEYKKFSFRVSTYGDSREVYRYNTGRDYFDYFIGKVNMLFKHIMKHKSKILEEFSMRFSGFSRKKLNNVTNPLYRVVRALLMEGLIQLDDTGIDEFNINTNDLVKVREDIYENKPVEVGDRKGICPMSIADNGIWPDGDISMCSWFDINKKMIIGNIFGQSLDEVYGEKSLFLQIIGEQKEGLYRSLCKVCSIFDSPEYKKEIVL